MHCARASLKPIRLPQSPPHLPKQSPAQERVKHHPAVPWRDIPTVATRLCPEDKTNIGRDALLFLILTAGRSGEIRDAQWQEFNLRGRIWTDPAWRMKTKRVHRVALSSVAVDLIERRKVLRLDKTFVFSRGGGRPISAMTMTKMLRDHKVPRDTPGRLATAHGFRSNFRDWAFENGDPKDVAERAISHTVRNQKEAA